MNHTAKDTHRNAAIERSITPAQSSASLRDGFKWLVAGSVGGALLGIAAYPLDLITARLENKQSRKKTLFKAPRKLGRGLSAQVIHMSPLCSFWFLGYYCGTRLAGRAVPPTATQLDSSSGLAQAQANSHTQSSLVAALGGALAAVPTTLLTAPLERINHVLSTAPRGSAAAAAMASGRGVNWIMQTHTVRSLYKGAAGTLLCGAVGSAAYFSSYEWLRWHLRVGDRDRSASALVTGCGSILIAGGIAGLANGLASTPFEVIKSRWLVAQDGKYKNVGDLAIQIVKKEGFHALFKLPNMKMGLARAFITNAFCFLGVESTLSFLNYS